MGDGEVFSAIFSALAFVGDKGLKTFADKMSPSKFVYLATVFKKQGDFEFPTEYSENAILCEPSTLKVFGYLD
jgi:hypothetical protein